MKVLIAYATKFGTTKEIAEQIAGHLAEHDHECQVQPAAGVTSLRGFDAVMLGSHQQIDLVTPTLLVEYGGPWAENYYFQNTDVLNNQKLRRYIPGELVNAMMRRRPQWFRPEEYSFKEIAKGAADIVKAGGRVGIGGHGQMQGLGVHWELWAVQSGGMPTHDALRVATIFGAEAIGLDGDIGSLEPGKLADLIVLDKNPLADIQNTDSIRYVMKNGELFEGDTLTRQWPDQKRLEKQYWWDLDPK